MVGAAATATTAAGTTATITLMGGTVASVAAARGAGTTRATRDMEADPAVQEDPILGEPMAEPDPVLDPDPDLGKGAAGPGGAAIHTKGPLETLKEVLN